MTVCNADNLTSYVDGALRPEEADEMQQHLAACPACASVAASHQRIRSMLAVHANTVAPPATLAASVAGLLDRMPPPSVARPHPWRTLGGKAGFLAIVAATGIWFSRPLWQPRPLDVQALVWRHLHAQNPPAGESLPTQDPAAGRRWLGSRLGLPPVAPVLDAAMSGVGVCQVGDAPAAIWMYRAPEPVSLIEVSGRYSLPDWPEAQGPYIKGTYGGYNTVVWREQGKTLVMVSRLPAERLIRLVEHHP